MSDTIRIKVHRVVGYAPGSEVVVSVHDRFWQRRLKDAQRDSCCEVVESRSKGKAEKPQPRRRTRRPARAEAQHTEEKT